MQTITSAKTSRNIIPAGIKQLVKDHTIKAGMNVLDFGGGKYDRARDFVADAGATLHVYDPYNRTEEENNRAIAVPADLVVCMNVLNVIDTESGLFNVANTLASMSRVYECEVMISVFEGLRSGRSKVTRDGFQRNQRLDWYVPILKEHFPKVLRRKRILACDGRMG